jgi:hypothetical protein
MADASVPAKRTGPSEISTDTQAAWSAQIGPDISPGLTYGYVYSNPANFYVSLNTGPNQPYCWYLDQNNNWQQLPNNQLVQGTGAGAGIEWAFNVPTGVVLKFLMGPA